MNIRIDIEKTTFLFTRLMDQLKKALQDGEFKPGTALLFFRPLANDLDLNRKTVVKASSCDV